MQFLDADCDEGQYVSDDGDGSVILPSQAINFQNQLTIAYRFVFTQMKQQPFSDMDKEARCSVYNCSNGDKLY